MKRVVIVHGLLLAVVQFQQKLISTGRRRGGQQEELLFTNRVTELFLNLHLQVKNCPVKLLDELLRSSVRENDRDGDLLHLPKTSNTNQKFDEADGIQAGDKSEEGEKSDRKVR